MSATPKPSLIKRFGTSLRGFLNRWWRPTFYWATTITVIVNGIALPFITKTYPDLSGLSLLVASATPAAILRTVEKMKGLA